MTARPRPRRPIPVRPAVKMTSADLLLLQLAGLTEADDSPDSLRSALIANSKPNKETRS